MDDKETTELYDVDVLLTANAPDTKDDVLRDPFTEGLSPTYAKVQEIALKHGGHWADWEPYRITFEIPVENVKAFVREVFTTLCMEVTFDKEQLVPLFEKGKSQCES